MRLIVEQSTEYQSFLAGIESFEATLADLEASIAADAETLSQLMAPHDAFNILEHVRFHELAHNPETYRETEHEGLAAVVELVGIVLACRPNRLSDHQAGDPPPIDEILILTRNLLELGSQLRLVSAIAEADSMSLISHKAASQNAHLRSLSYPHMAQEMVSSLFLDPAIEPICRKICGFLPTEAMAVIGAHGSLHAIASQQSFMEVASAFNAVRLDDEPNEESLAQVRIAMETLFTGGGERNLFSAKELSEASGLSHEIVSAVHDALSVQMHEADVAASVGEYLGGKNPFRDAPFLRSADGALFLIHSGFSEVAARESAEAKLKDGPGWDQYAKHRGDFLESEALQFLKRLLPTSTVYRSIEFFVPDPTAKKAESIPRNYSKLVEADGILVIDDVAIAFEAKAGRLSSRARKGEAGPLSQSLKKIVSHAAKQASRTRHGILEDGGLRLRNDEWLDLNKVREVYTVTVSLDDLSGIAAVTADLVDAGLLDHDEVPWTVSLLDLRVIAEVLEKPAEFLEYLRRRTNPLATRYFVATDELDYFMEFMNGGLYVNHDPERKLDELPMFGEPTVADRRSFKKQQPMLLTSLTDPLDEWYAHQLGQRQTPAPKPVRGGVPEVLQLVDDLAELAEPGWLSTGADILGMNQKSQVSLASHVAYLVSQSAEDGKPHTLTVPVGSTFADSKVLIWKSIGPNQTVASSRQLLESYVPAKKHQLKAARGIGMAFDTRGNLEYTVFDNTRLAANPALDELVTQMGLSTAEQMETRAKLGQKMKRSQS